MTDATPTATLRALVERATGEHLDDAPGTTVGGRGDSPGPAERLRPLLAGTRSVVAVVPRLDPSIVAAVRGRNGGSRVGDSGTVGHDGGADARIVCVGQARDRVTGPAGAALRAVAREEGIRLSVADGDSRVGFLLAGDSAVAIGLFDGAGLAALVTSDAPAVRSWVAATCSRYATAADPV